MAVVEFERRGTAAWITLNRPDRHNTLTGESFQLLAAAWDEVRSDDEILVAVLAAAGETDFCCGGDIGDYISPLADAAGETPGGGPDAESDYRRALLLDEPLYKPVIAAVNGRALGGGTELIQATDIRVAAENAAFGLPEPRLGIVPGAGSLVRLARQVPYAHAMRILLTGDQIDAATALQWGLVSEVVPQARLRDRADELAQRVAANGPVALRTIKRIVHETHTMDWGAAHAAEFTATNAVLATEDAQEGPAAFLAKRPPRFAGK